LDFRDDVIGHEAKFRNAKISFYTGDFDWAQGQLDVLKASTSKLISNDALHLSLIITDNFNLDTTALPMQQFARADLLLYQNKYTECLATLDSITKAFPNHSLTDDILFEKAQIYERMHLIDSAYTYYNELVEIHFMGIYADDALFRMAEIQDKYKQNPQEAHKLYDKILTDFPGSLYVLEARKRFREFQP
jgi:tetratricopeptide (TPR) repeat protein